MKKAIAYFFTLIMFLLLSSILLLGCKAKPLPIDTNKETLIKNDSSSHTQTIDRSKAIVDSLLIAIASVKTAKPECDSITQNAINNVLRAINAKKSSGDNSYQLKYNELLKRLELIVKTGPTKNVVTQDVHQKQIYINRYITKTVTVERKMPKWQLILMLIGFATIVFQSVKFVFLIRSKIPA